MRIRNFNKNAVSRRLESLSAEKWRLKSYHEGCLRFSCRKPEKRLKSVSHKYGTLVSVASFISSLLARCE
jgi:hypothetical protein